jgi:hypothetical protein
MDHLENLSLPLSDIISSNLNEEYSSTFRTWINSTKVNTLLDFDKFIYSDFSHGTTESFDKFYISNYQRRMRFFKADYAYHKLSHRNFAFLEDDDIRPEDAIIISLPFSDTGSEYNYDHILQQADYFNVPVFVDCCWFGTCQNITFDFSYPCISALSFSLSKSFPVSRFRIGIRFSKEILEDGLTTYTKDNYVNNLSQFIGLSFMNKFSPDYIPLKYKEKQLLLCDELKISPSKVVMLGLGGEDWKNLNRGGQHNRLCLSDFFVD